MFNSKSGRRAALLLILFLLVNASVFAGGKGETVKDNEDTDTFKGVFVVASSPDNLKNMYSIHVFGKFDYKTCGSRCPVVSLYVSLIGEGDPPELSSFFVAEGYGWKFEGWKNLPAMPLTDTEDDVKLMLSSTDADGNRQNWLVSAAFDELSVERLESR